MKQYAFIIGTVVYPSGEQDRETIGKYEDICEAFKAFGEYDLEASNYDCLDLELTNEVEKRQIQKFMTVRRWRNCFDAWGV